MSDERNFEEESKLASDRYFDAPSDDKEIWQKGYITGAKTEYELLKPQLEYANNTINKFSEALVTRDSNLKRISIEFVEFLRDEAWELEYRDQRDYTLEELYEFFEKNICKAGSEMRYDKLTTDEVIDLLKQEGNTIYWTEEAYRRMPDGIDWDRVAKELGTEEIHTYNQGMKTVAYDLKPPTK